MRLSLRRGDGAQQALLAFSRLPALTVASPKSKVKESPGAPKTTPKEVAEAPKEPAEKKGLLSGLRGMWTKKKKGSAPN